MNAMLVSPSSADLPSMHGSQADVRPIHLGLGGTLSLAVDDDGPLVLVYGEGGGCTLHVEGAAQAIFIPLRGSVLTTTPSHAGPVCAGEVLVSQLDCGIEAVGYARARWIALLGGGKTWARKLDRTRVFQMPGVQLLPAQHVASRELRRCAIAMVRATEKLALKRAANVVIDCVAALQAPLCESISRCPGRTHAKRVKVFLRLQRIRKLISDGCDQELNNAALARLANYSPCHFLSTFNRVFGETPHAYLLTERLRRARQLLRSSDLAISEVALTCGFKNPSAFSRLFRQRFGMTAMDVRCRGGRLARTNRLHEARSHGLGARRHHASPRTAPDRETEVGT